MTPLSQGIPVYFSSQQDFYQKKQMRAYKSLTDRSFILDKFAADDLYFPHENEEFNGGIIEIVKNIH